MTDAYQIIIQQAWSLGRSAAEFGNDGTNDLVVSDLIRINELQIWFLNELLVDVPLVKAKEQANTSGAS